MNYVMADVHGRYDKYRKMLEEIEFSMEDTLYVLGDVIDRGPDGIKILRDMSGRVNVLPILGNHEFTAAMCIPWLLKEVTETSLSELSETELAALNEWLMNGGGPTLRAFKKLDAEEREDILDYLREMELFAEVEAGGRRFVLVHAGLGHFSQEKPLDDYELPDFLFGRPDPGQTYFDDRILVFGHTPVRVLREQAGEAPSDDIWHKGNLLAIDCGCAFGGKLGCVCLDTMEEFYT